MADWSQLEQEAPDLAAVGRALWERNGLMYLATTRPDGSPRVHPVAPLLAEGAVFVAMSEGSPKWRDLRRDPRCVLHCLPGARDDEFVLRCRAWEAPEVRAAVRAAAGHLVGDDDHIIGFDLEEADYGWWEYVGQPDTYSVRRRWRPGRGVEELAGLRHDRRPDRVVERSTTDEDALGFPVGSDDEKELLLQWVRYLRGAVLRKVDRLDDDGSRWSPDGKLISLIGIVNHLTSVEWRWIDGTFGGAEVVRSEEEFHPERRVSMADVVDAYRRRGIATEAVVRAVPLDEVGAGWGAGKRLRFVLLHLINETARHAGHADATREMLDGTTGE